MKLANVTMLISIAVAATSLVACKNSDGGAIETASGYGSAPRTQPKKVEQQPVVQQNNNSQPSTNSQQQSASQQQQQQQTVVTQTETRNPLWEGYQNPSPAEMNNPANIVIYNYMTDQAIVAINGQRLNRPLPPGKSMVIPKLFEHLSEDESRYNLNVMSDRGATGAAQFDSSMVNAAGWKASVSMNAAIGRLEIKQNAGGDGGGDDGGDGGAGGTLNNFNDSANLGLR